MGHYERVRAALRSTVAKVKHEINHVKKQGQKPAQYSLGFANGLILANHHLNNTGGTPEFFTEDEASDQLPKPVALLSPDQLAYQDREKELSDFVISDAENLVNRANQIGDVPGLNTEITELRLAMGKLIEFYNEMAAKNNPEPVLDFTEGAKDGSSEASPQVDAPGAQETTGVDACAFSAPI